MTIRLASLDRDSWTLASGEARHAEFAEVVPPFFIGRLTNAPAAAGPDFYLELDVEVPFLPEHVIDIEQPPRPF